MLDKSGEFVFKNKNRSSLSFVFVKSFEQVHKMRKCVPISKEGNECKREENFDECLANSIQASSKRRILETEQFC